MKNFTIENETNNIMIHGSAKEAEAVPNSERFSNEAALAKMAANWAAARLVEIWNSLPGETPVKKFKDRATAVSRIWKAIQGLGHSAPAPAEEPATAPEVAPAPEQEASETVQPEAAIPATTESAPATPVASQSPAATPEQAPAKKKATRTKKAPTSATNATGPREGSKTSQVIEMLKRKKRGRARRHHGQIRMAETYHARAAERRRIDHEEVRTDRYQREGRRRAAVFHQRLSPDPPRSL